MMNFTKDSKSPENNKKISSKVQKREKTPKTKKWKIGTSVKNSVDEVTMMKEYLRNRFALKNWRETSIDEILNENNNLNQ